MSPHSSKISETKYIARDRVFKYDGEWHALNERDYMAYLERKRPFPSLNRIWFDDDFSKAGLRYTRIGLAMMSLAAASGVYSFFKNKADAKKTAHEQQVEESRA